MDNNKFYIFVSDWQGISLLEIGFFEPAFVCETQKEAEKRVEWLYEYILDPDEGCYIWHNHIFIYEG